MEEADVVEKSVKWKWYSENNNQDNASKWAGKTRGFS